MPTNRQGWTLQAQPNDFTEVGEKLEAAFELNAKHYSPEVADAISDVCGSIEEWIDAGILGEGPFNISLGGNDGMSLFVNIVSRKPVV